MRYRGKNLLQSSGLRCHVCILEKSLDHQGQGWIGGTKRQRKRIDVGAGVSNGHAWNRDLNNSRCPKMKRDRCKWDSWGRTDGTQEQNGCGVKQREDALVLFCLLVKPLLFQLTAPQFSFESTAPTCLTEYSFHGTVIHRFLSSVVNTVITWPNPGQSLCLGNLEIWAWAWSLILLFKSFLF